MSSSSAHKFDVIVVGGGHAGIEASLAAARMGASTALLTMNPEAIGRMSCNPSVGGVGKGQLVKELDALGGEMARVTDLTGLQFKQLNMKKGPAVRSSRAQVDMFEYADVIRNIVEKQNGLTIIAGAGVDITVEGGAITGVILGDGRTLFAPSVVLCPGTFLNGKMFIGHTSVPGGRIGEAPARSLTDSLAAHGLPIGRLKTGTVPRIDPETINVDGLIEDRGDEPPRPLSFRTEKVERPSVSCYLTYTSYETHRIIQENVNKSAMYGGLIEGVGPRYCPSIEDKIMRFPDKERHQIFLEPEGLTEGNIYPNGISTSLPEEVQTKFVRSIPGLEKAVLKRPGYAVEYDYVEPTSLHPWLESRVVSGLFLAGQINGTSGYAEAGAQGILAGINAALRLDKQEDPFVLKRSEAYMGVLVDDLTTKGTQEPYRMFTSRCEYRLTLREDNADQRLTPTAYKYGLVSKAFYDGLNNKRQTIERWLEKLSSATINPTSEVKSELVKLGTATIPNQASLKSILRRPEIKFEDVRKLMRFSTEGDFTKWQNEPVPPSVIEQIEIDTKYEGYVEKQAQQIERFESMESQDLPETIDYKNVPSLSAEVVEKLERIRPRSLGQASRISGMTPAAIATIMVYLKTKKPPHRASR